MRLRELKSSHPFPEGYFFCVKKTPDRNRKEKKAKAASTQQVASTSSGQVQVASTSTPTPAPSSSQSELVKLLMEQQKALSEQLEALKSSF